MLPGAENETFRVRLGHTDFNLKMAPVILDKAGGHRWGPQVVLFRSGVLAMAALENGKQVTCCEEADQRHLPIQSRSRS